MIKKMPLSRYKLFLSVSMLLVLLSILGCCICNEKGSNGDDANRQMFVWFDDWMEVNKGCSPQDGDLVCYSSPIPVIFKHGSLKVQNLQYAEKDQQWKYLGKTYGILLSPTDEKEQYYPAEKVRSIIFVEASTSLVQEAFSKYDPKYVCFLHPEGSKKELLSEIPKHKLLELEYVGFDEFSYPCAGHVGIGMKLETKEGISFDSLHSSMQEKALLRDIDIPYSEGSIVTYGENLDEELDVPSAERFISAEDFVTLKKYSKIDNARIRVWNNAELVQVLKALRHSRCVDLQIYGFSPDISSLDFPNSFEKIALRFNSTRIAGTETPSSISANKLIGSAIKRNKLEWLSVYSEYEPVNFSEALAGEIGRSFAPHVIHLLRKTDPCSSSVKVNIDQVNLSNLRVAQIDGISDSDLEVLLDAPELHSLFLSNPEGRELDIPHEFAGLDVLAICGGSVLSNWLGRLVGCCKGRLSLFNTTINGELTAPSSEYRFKTIELYFCSFRTSEEVHFYQQLFNNCNEYKHALLNGCIFNPSDLKQTVLTISTKAEYRGIYLDPPQSIMEFQGSDLLENLDSESRFGVQVSKGALRVSFPTWLFGKSAVIVSMIDREQTTLHLPISTIFRLLRVTGKGRT